MFGKISHVFSGTVNANVVKTMYAAKNKIQFYTINDLVEAWFNTLVIANFDSGFYA